MRATLFVGPSVPPEEVRSAFDGEIRPPIKRGDIVEVLSRPEPPKWIGVVDGRFLHELAVTPKEVLRALFAGARVYGSSSMGALRAAECAPFGMIGVGRIFEMYSRRELEADDEVAITFDAQNLRPLSEPMVNIRIAVRAAVDAGVVAKDAGALAVRTAKSMYFPTRSYGNLRAALRGRMPAEQHQRLFDFLTGPDSPDQKREDALRLIAAIQAAAALDSPEGGGDRELRRDPGGSINGAEVVR
jgi:hypothetical protein